MPAGELERIVAERLRAIGSDPAVLAQAVAQARQQDQQEMASLEAERRALGKDATRREQDLRGLAAELATAQDATSVLDRMAALRQRSSQDERRLLAVGERMQTLREGLLHEDDARRSPGTVRAGLGSHGTMRPGAAGAARRRERRVRRAQGNAADHVPCLGHPRAGRRDPQPSGQEGERMTARLTVECQVHVRREAKGPKALEEGPAPLPEGRVPRVARLLALAHRFDGMLRQGEADDYADLARRGQVTRARLTQVMNLLLLAPDIQEAILFLPRVRGGRDPVRMLDLQRWP